jgi:hypothetical protein
MSLASCTTIFAPIQGHAMTEDRRRKIVALVALFFFLMFVGWAFIGYFFAPSSVPKNPLFMFFAELYGMMPLYAAGSILLLTPLAVIYVWIYLIATGKWPNELSNDRAITLFVICILVFTYAIREGVRNPGKSMPWPGYFEQK